jgi:hypothetical protein
LARNGVEVIFVVPKAYGDEDQRFIRVVNASDVDAIYRSGDADSDIWRHVKFMEINSNMVPYISPEQWEEERSRSEKVGTVHHDGDVWRERYTFSGKYGANLLEEVARYAVVARQVAIELEGQFDVIHAHDWLTYYAGIAAKEVSGKPLVVHMHATEFDRSGENINTQTYAIERGGMEAADLVMAVSKSFFVSFSDSSRAKHRFFNSAFSASSRAMYLSVYIGVNVNYIFVKVTLSTLVCHSALSLK